MVEAASHRPAQAHTPAFSILTIFARLGVTSFGGPIAHLGYFRDEFVGRRRWLDEAAYADLVAVCQFLPGPASSQVGFAIGLARGGLLGGLAAWAGFTLPSVGLLLLFAYGLAGFDGPLAQGALHGLKLVAVAIVAQAVWGMARALCPDRARASVAVLTVVATVGIGGALGQVAAIVLGAVAGLWLVQRGLVEAPSPSAAAPGLRVPVSRPVATGLLVLTGALLILLPLLTGAGIGGHALALFDAFYRAGALVFGGGHVVLPLLEDSVVASGWLSADAFVAGYGATQAVPGPLFTFAAYLGALSGPAPNGLVGATIALGGVFLPGLLLVAGTLPHWDAIRHVRSVRAAMIGVNAAVVGLLGAALYDPVWTSAVTTPTDFALALTGFVLLVGWRAPSWAVVAGLAAAGIVLTLV